MGANSETIVREIETYLPCPNGINYAVLRVRGLSSRLEMCVVAQDWMAGEFNEHGIQLESSDTLRKI